MFGIPIAALRGRADFRQLYAAGYMVQTGHRHQLYDYDSQKKVQDALVSQEDLACGFRYVFIMLAHLKTRFAEQRADIIKGRRERNGVSCGPKS